MLLPQVLPGMPGGALRVGLVLSALPAGFGVAAPLTGDDRVYCNGAWHGPGRDHATRMLEL